LKKSRISKWTDEMNSGAVRNGIPVLLLHNIDPCWEPSEIKTSLDAVNQLRCSLMEQGHTVSAVAVDHENLPVLLEPFDPDSWVVFNWCEEIPGSPRSDWRVVKVLESMQFTYTGSPAHVLDRSWDKAGAKRRMDQHGVPTPRWALCSETAPPDWNCFPAIVKPAYEHCSVGINSNSVVLDRTQLLQRIRHVKKVFGQSALI
jgi:D-alanine-D-alanine ligase